LISIIIPKIINEELNPIRTKWNLPERIPAVSKLFFIRICFKTLFQKNPEVRIQYSEEDLKYSDSMLKERPESE
jgi:hypothetical protein